MSSPDATSGANRPDFVAGVDHQPDTGSGSDFTARLASPDGDQVKMAAKHRGQAAMVGVRSNIEKQLKNPGNSTIKITLEIFFPGQAYYEVELSMPRNKVQELKDRHGDQFYDKLEMMAAEISGTPIGGDSSGLTLLNVLAPQHFMLFNERRELKMDLSKTGKFSNFEFKNYGTLSQMRLEVGGDRKNIEDLRKKKNDLENELFGMPRRGAPAGVDTSTIIRNQKKYIKEEGQAKFDQKMEELNEVEGKLRKLTENVEKLEKIEALEKIDDIFSTLLRKTSQPSPQGDMSGRDSMGIRVGASSEPRPGSTLENRVTHERREEGGQ